MISPLHKHEVQDVVGPPGSQQDRYVPVAPKCGFEVEVQCTQPTYSREANSLVTIYTKIS